ncbi:amidase signature domain-containing protein [Xylariales sp. PMI_506]|nr:amidase signature domain-containing protein [Xylariales sp. PMI_506]
MDGLRFDPLTTNAVDLQQQLQSGQITTVDVVQQYLAQIERWDHAVNAFISLAPRDTLMRTAASLDAERRQGKVRSPLHGTPIVLKDCFVTASELGMSTTAGSWALVGATARQSGAIVKKLTDAGLIIIGKTNMTEFCGMKMFKSPGSSAYGGQTLSAYVGKIEADESILGHSSPGGSSTGSAVAISAGFSPLALGSETIGSIVTPSCRAGLYALKPTTGTQDPTGMYRMTDFFDSPGPMAKSPADVVAISEILLSRSFDRAKLRSWEGISVGFLDPNVWSLAEAMCRQHEGTAEQMVQDYEAMVEKLKASGCSLKYPVEVADASTLTVDGEDAIMPIAFWDFKNIGIPEFLQSFDQSPVQSLKDIIDYNENNKEKALPPPHTDQDLLVQAQEANQAPEHISCLKEKLRAVARKALDDVFEREGINIIIAPAASALPTHTSAAGYPVAAVPLGQLRCNGRPFGLCAVGRAHEEETLLRFMAAYEAVASPRPVPDFAWVS